MVSPRIIKKHFFGAEIKRKGRCSTENDEELQRESRQRNFTPPIPAKGDCRRSPPNKHWNLGFTFSEGPRGALPGLHLPGHTGKLRAPRALHRSRGLCGTPPACPPLCFLQFKLPRAPKQQIPPVGKASARSEGDASLLNSCTLHGSRASPKFPLTYEVKTQRTARETFPSYN